MSLDEGVSEAEENNSGVAAARESVGEAARRALRSARAHDTVLHNNLADDPATMGLPVNASMRAFRGLKKSCRQTAKSVKQQSRRQPGMQGRLKLTTHVAHA